ncbi:MAG: efflux RND transporter periplasmic adaptor subunit, partial [Acidobacteriota bacterium]
IVVAVALAGYLPRKQRQEAAASVAKEEKNTLPRVSAAKVTRAPQDTEVLLPGTISPLAEASLFARAAGYVKKRYADIGDRVREGQLIAEIEAPELDQQVAQARAAVSQAEQQLGQTRASLLQAQSQRDLAKLTAERYNNLVGRGAVARQDADTQQATYKTAEALVAAQEANVSASGENVRQTQANLQRIVALQDFKNVRAPFAGVITVRNIDVGSLISPTGGGQGMSQTPGGTAGAAGNEMYRVAQIATVRIMENVPQTNAPGIRIGMPAEVSVTEFPDRKFHGTVARTSNSLDPASRTMLVEVHVENRDGKLLPGMYAEVRFRGHRDSPPVLVPGNAVIAGNAGPQVAVLEDASVDNGNPDTRGAKKIHLIPVRIGRDYGVETEVISGLTGSETVVMNPGDDVREGALVRAETGSESKSDAAAQKGAPK